MYENLLQIAIPPIVISLVFAAGVFYRRVGDLEVSVGHLREYKTFNSQEIAAINKSLIAVQTELKSLSESHKEFREEIRRTLQKKD